MPKRKLFRKLKKLRIGKNKPQGFRKTKKGQKSKVRKLTLKKRKSFLPTLILVVLLWGILAGFVYFVDPTSPGAVPMFFALLFLALLLTLSVIFTNTRRGLLTAVGLTLLIILRYFGVGNILNLALIAGIIITIEVYFN